MPGTTPRRGLHGELVHRIGLRILHGELQPGDILSPDDEPVGGAEVSRSVWRETMRVLAAKGLVESRQSVGTRVLPPSSWSLLDLDVLGWLGEINPDQQLLRELTELRRVVEPDAARMAAERATDEEVAEIRRRFETMTGATGDADAYGAADIAFHSAILAASHNNFVQQLSAAVVTALRSSRAWLARQWMLTEGQAALAETLPDHEAVVKAIAARDGRRAERKMTALIDAHLVNLERVFEAVE